MNDRTQENLSYSLDCRNMSENTEVSAPIQAKNNGGHSLNYINPIVYDARCVGNGQLGGMTMAEISNALDCMHDQQAVLLENSGKSHGIADTLDASYWKGTGARNGCEREIVATQAKPPRKYIVRRLTPLECCRLQGFPDWWEDGVQGSDSARYKMWGNGMALPNMLHVMKGIRNITRPEKDWIDTLLGDEA